MRRIKFFVIGASFLLFSFAPVWAFMCPTLIKEGRDLLATTKISQANQQKAKALLDESEKLHEQGDHGESIKKAREALSLLGKK